MNAFPTLICVATLCPGLIAQSVGPAGAAAPRLPKRVPAPEPLFRAGHVYPSQNGICETVGVVRNAVADLNRDGIPDVVSTTSNTSGSDGDVVVYLGGPFGSLERLVAIPMPGPGAIAIGDVNGDDIADLGVATFNPFSVSFLIGDGTGHFSVSTVVPLDAVAPALRLADLDGDGHLDLIAASSSQGAIPVFLGDGGGGFVAVPSIPAGSLALDVILLRLPGDDVPDVAVSDYLAGTVSVFEGNGDGTFVARQVFSIGAMSGMLAVANLNGDGIDDLLVAGDTTVKVFLGSAVGLVPAPDVDGVTPYPFVAPAPVDLDGDRVPDLACASLWGLLLSQGLGDGTFDPPVPAPYLFNSPLSETDGIFDVDIADMDGDLRLDLVLAQTASVAVVFGDGQGGVLSGMPLSTGGLTSSGPSGVVTGGHKARKVLIDDFNSDGLQDLVTLHFGYSVHQGSPSTVVPVASSISVHLGQAGAGFAQPSHHEVGLFPRDVLAADLDGDGYLDLAVLHNSISNRSVTTLVNTGSGTFLPGTPHFFGWVHNPSLAVFDTGTDGIPDLVVAIRESTGGATLRTWAGLGDGTFAAAGSEVVTLFGETFDRIEAERDIDGDSVTDLYLAGGYLGGPLSYCLGNGDGSFTSPVGVSGLAGLSIGTVAGLRDLDGDGLLDLVGISPVHSSRCSTEGEYHELSAFLATSPTSFAAPIVSPIELSLQGPSNGSWTLVGDGDVDGDGWTDLLLRGTAGYRDVLDVIVSDGAGAFASTPGNLMLGTTTGLEGLARRGQFLADLNGDGKLDIACPWNTVAESSSGDANGDGYCDSTGAPMPCSTPPPPGKVWPGRIGVFFNRR